MGSRISLYFGFKGFENQDSYVVGLLGAIGEFIGAGYKIVNDFPRTQMGIALDHRQAFIPPHLLLSILRFVNSIGEAHHGVTGARSTTA